MAGIIVKARQPPGVDAACRDVVEGLQYRMLRNNIWEGSIKDGQLALKTVKKCPLHLHCISGGL